MKDIISVNIATDLNHTYECETNILGREGEGDTTQLQLTIPEALLNYDVYLDFEKPNGEKIRTPKLEVTDGVAVYDVSQYILDDDGEIKVQAVFQIEGGAIWKSSIKKYFNTDSINAVDDIPEKEDFITEAQRILDELSAEVAEIAELLSNDTDFISSIVNTIEDARWVNTVTGTRLKFFVGTKAEYEALEDKEDLFAIITDDTTKDDLLAEIEALKTSAQQNAKDIQMLGEAFVGHTHNGLLCSVTFTSGTARLPEASANELVSKMCFIVFEEEGDSKKLHSGVFYIANDVNIDDTPQPEHTYTAVCGNCGSFKLAYYPNATYTDNNMTLYDKDGNTAGVNGTLSIYRMGVI